MRMKKLYEFCWDCGRQGSLQGLFIAEAERVEAVIGKRIEFGEVLGKHSDVSGILEASDLTVKSEHPEVLRILSECFQDGTISGYNPLEYYEEENEGCARHLGAHAQDEKVPGTFTWEENEG